MSDYLKSVSQPTTITGNALITFTHGLGARPDLVNILVNSYTGVSAPRFKQCSVDSVYAIWEWENVGPTDSVTVVCIAQINHSIVDGPIVTGVAAGSGGMSASTGAISFNVRNFGGVGDGVTDDTTAIEKTMAAAAATIKTINGLALSAPEVYIPEGGWLQSRPIHIPNGVGVRGAGPGATVVSWKDHVWGYSFLAADEDNGSASLHYTVAYGGSALICDYSAGDADTHSFVDLSQYTYGRLPAGDWTIRFARYFTNIAAEVGQGLPILFIGALTPWSTYPVPATALNLHFDLFAADGSMQLDYRFHNVLTTVTAPFVTTPVLQNNTWYEFEIAYDDAAGTLRVYLNGELWTRGALALTGSGPNSDTSKLRQWVWERFGLGSVTFFGFPNEDFIFPSPLGAIKGFHLSSVVRHTTSYMVTDPRVDPTGDANTRLRCDFSQVYKGHLVASGVNDNTTVYLRPVRNGVVTEHPRVQIRDLSILLGSGIRFEFASEGLIDNVIASYVSAGIELVRNCYFTHISHVRVLNGVRAGVLDLGGAYENLQAVDTSCPIGFALGGANVTMSGCESAAHSGAALNLIIDGGTGSAIGFSVDNEENTGATPWIAAIVLSNTATYSLTDLTAYNPPDNLTQSPVLVVNTVPATAYNIIGGLMFSVPANVSLVRLVGSYLNLDNKIVLAGVSNLNGSTLCNVAGQARDPFAASQTALTGLSSTDTPAHNLAGLCTIAGANNYGLVTFGTAETDVNYRFLPAPCSLMGTPTIGSNRPLWTAKGKACATLVVENAPGAGNAVIFDWMLIR